MITDDHSDPPKTKHAGDCRWLGLGLSGSLPRAVCRTGLPYSIMLKHIESTIIMTSVLSRGCALKLWGFVIDVD